MGHSPHAMNLLYQLSKYTGAAFHKALTIYYLRVTIPHNVDKVASISS
jgi:hypothetical protein